MKTPDDFLLMNQEEKAEAFNRIANEFYARNFGRMSKGDIDVLMFSILINQTTHKNYSDYQIAQQLGITESRVRSFRVKSHLTYDNDE